MTQSISGPEKDDVKLKYEITKGTVVEHSNSSTATVRGYRGTVTSRIETSHEIWLRTDDGREVPLTLKNSELRVLPGQTVAKVSVIVEQGDNETFRDDILVKNISTGDVEELLKPGAFSIIWHFIGRGRTYKYCVQWWWRALFPPMIVVSFILGFISAAALASGDLALVGFPFFIWVAYGFYCSVIKTPYLVRRHGGDLKKGFEDATERYLNEA